jgi:hypothetical protein
MYVCIYMYVCVYVYMHKRVALLRKNYQKISMTECMCMYVVCMHVMNVCMYMYVCIYVRTYVWKTIQTNYSLCVCVCVCVCVCTYACMHYVCRVSFILVVKIQKMRCVCVRVCLHAYIHTTHPCTYSSITRKRVGKTEIATTMCVCIHAYLHIFTNPCMRTYIHLGKPYTERVHKHSRKASPSNTFKWICALNLARAMISPRKTVLPRKFALSS